MNRQVNKQKTVLFDLDGTLTNTMSAEFRPYRDGQALINTSQVPVFSGAREVVQKLQQDGHQVFIVSDSHPKFVNPIARDIFKVKALSLAYKPSIDKIKKFIEENSRFKLANARSRIFLIGDTTLDIYSARKLGIPSVHMIHEQNFQPEIWADTQKGGPTFTCRNFKELYHIISNPLDQLLVIEGMDYSEKCRGEIKIGEVDYKASAGRKLYGISLARQETGPCDRFGKASFYYEFGSVGRKPEFLSKLADCVARYISYFVESRGVEFDILSFVPDKRTTVPRQKMEAFTELIKCGIPIQGLMKWKDTVTGSIRNQPHRRHRYKFVKNFMEMKDGIDLSGKNIIVIDDQITTGATMDAAADLLRKKGAQHILFIALFRMITALNTGKKCPSCGKEMSMKARKSDGNRFYSCVPARYGGVGCGHTQNI